MVGKMTTAPLIIQQAIRNALVTDAGLTALVPATAILDTNSRPAPSPSIILGEDQIVDDGEMIARDVLTVYSTLHLWKKETGLVGVKGIAGEIALTIRANRPALSGGFQLVDWFVSQTRFLRDPDGVTAHGVVTIESTMRLP
jgi:hypothetical protein